MLQSIALAFSEDTPTMAKTKIAAEPAKSSAAPAKSGYSELDLAGQFQLTSPKHKLQAPIVLPGDVHTALLDAK